MSILTRIAALLLTTGLASGCVTGPAVIDAVVPNPVTLVVMERQEDDVLRWTATYGRRRALATVEVTRSGSLDVPASLAGCSPFVHHSLQGSGLGEIGELPRGTSTRVDSLVNSRLDDAPRVPPRFLSPKRLAAVVVAPFLDVFLVIAIPVLMAAGAPLS